MLLVYAIVLSGNLVLFHAAPPLIPTLSTNSLNSQLVESEVILQMSRITHTLVVVKCDYDQLRTVEHLAMRV